MLNLCCSLPVSLLIYATFLITTSVCIHGPYDIILRPFNPVVEDGQALTLNCTITPEYTGNYTNSDLRFRLGSIYYSNVMLVGNRTALLRRQWSLSDNAHVLCMLPDRPLTVSAVQHITVVRRPLEPNVTRCLLLNWNEVNCTWEPSLSQQSDHMHTYTPLIQTVEWKLSDEVNDIWHDAFCRDIVIDNFCVWNISRTVSRFVEAESCCVRVLARINLDSLQFNVQSAQFCFHPANNVILSQPRNLTAVSKEAHQMNVNWQAPLLDVNRMPSIVYAVTVMSQWSDTPVINVSVLNDSLLFPSVPHTRYNVSVKVKTNESLFWSMPSYHIFTTASAIPNNSPPSSPNAFTVTHVEKYSRTVIIYWKTLPPQDRHGERLSYIVLMRKPPVLTWSEWSVVPSPDEPCKDVVVDTDSAVELTVIARNEVNDTVPDVVMHLPPSQSSGATASAFVKLVVELTNSSMVVWSWQLQTSPQHAASLTLFWCKSQSLHYHCVDDLHWLDVASSEAERSLSISTADTSQYSYGAAVMPDGTRRTETRGIEWVKCLYNMSGLAAPADDVKAVVPSYGEPGQLLVTWVQPPCDHHRGYIRSLVLQYCQLANSECVDEPSNVSLPGHLTAYSLRGLKHGVEYRVWIYSWTRAGQSLTHSDIAVAVTSAPVLTPAVIASLAVCGVIVLVLAAVVVWMLCKYCRRCRDKLWPPVTVTVPSASDRSDTNASTSSPIIEYSRISYTRQGSRLSSSSHDSGQFGVASGSPLMSPKSCSESVVTPLIAADTDHERQPPASTAQVNRGRPAARTYVNDDIAVLQRPAENRLHHRPLSSTTSGHAECFPLQPMTTHRSHDTAAGRFSSDNDDDDNQEKSRPNGGYDTVVLATDTNYIPHEWLTRNNAQRPAASASPAGWQAAPRP